MSWIKIKYDTVWIKSQSKVISQYVVVIKKAFTKYLVDKVIVYCNMVNMTKNLT